MEILCVILGILQLILLGVLIPLCLRGRQQTMSEGEREALLREFDARLAKSQREMREELAASLSRTVKELGELMLQNQRLSAEAQRHAIFSSSSTIKIFCFVTI